MKTAGISLRWRVTFAYTLLGALLSVLFASTTEFIAEDYEHILVEEILSGLAADFRKNLAEDPLTAIAGLPRSSRLSGYWRGADGQGEIPVEMARFGPGIHEHEEEDEGAGGLHFGVFDIAQGRLYFVIDLSDIEAREELLFEVLVAVVSIGTLLSGWLGWLFAGATIKPVMRLAAAVDRLPIVAVPTDLAASVGTDELGRLALAIDRYQRRLADADASERAFFADASHELRTPVAVVRGSVELLLEEPAADAGMLRRVRRLDRGVQELTELLEVLMDLVRRSALNGQTCDVQELLATAVEPWSGNPGLHIRIDGAATIETAELPAIRVLRGVIRQLLPPEAGGTFQIQANSLVLRLRFGVGDPVSNQDSNSQSSRSDRSLGLTLVGRLAQQLGWRIETIALDAAWREVHIHLPTATRGEEDAGDAMFGPVSTINPQS